MSWRPRVLVVCAALLGVFLAVGCGGEDEPTTVTESPTAPEESTALDTPAAADPTETTPGPEATAAATTEPDPEPAASDGSVYAVEEGDTLSSIAQRFGTTVEALVEANDLDDPDTIFPGDELTIPGLAATETPSP